MRPSLKKYYFVSLLLLVIQFIFWNGVDFAYESKEQSLWSGTRAIKPKLEVTPSVPSMEIIKSFALGDDEIAFRYYGYMLQFAGDTFGRVTPLKNYDFEKLYGWWNILDEVNSLSDLIPFMVSYYYAATQTPEIHIPYVVDYLEKHADKHPNDKWWWYSQAVYNAKFKLNDNQLALRIAQKLADLPKELEIPIWTRQMKAYIYEDEGDYNKACDVIVDVVRDFSATQLKEGEINFIYHFLTERLSSLVEAKERGEIGNISPECNNLLEVKKASDIKEKANEL